MAGVKGEESQFVKNLQNSVSEAALSESERVNIMLNVIKGGFSMVKDKFSWYQPCIKDKLFISAVVNGSLLDLHLLYKEVLPNLRSRGLAHGVDISFISLDYGNGDTEIYPNLEWEDHKLIAQECLSTSTSINFVSFLADEYGKISMPKSFLASIVAQHSSVITPATKALLTSCCTLDENAIPPRYVVNHIDNTADPSIIKQHSDLITSLSHDMEGISIGETLIGANVHSAAHETYYYFGQGIIEWIGKFMLSSDANIQKCLWFVKEFHPSHHVEDRRAMIKADSYGSWLKHKLHNHCIAVDTGVTKENFLYANTDAWEIKWAKNIEEKIGMYFDRTIDAKIRWDVSGNDIGVPGKVLDDILHHSNWAHAYRHFFGRSEVIKKALSMFNESVVEMPAITSRPANFRAVSFVIVGPSGAGKTALMTKLADVVYRTQAISMRPVIVRYIGTNRNSTTAFQLLQSICHQINLSYGVPYDPSINLLSYTKMVRLFHCLMQDYPVALFLDGMDKLKNNDLARTDLTFLSGAAIHPDSRIILSLRSTEEIFSNVALIDRVEDPFGCERKLSTGNVPQFVMNYMDMAKEEDRNDVGIIIQSILNFHQRMLTSEQLTLAQEYLNDMPSMFNIVLVAMNCLHWTSFGSYALDEPITTIVSRTVDEFEAKCGRALVRSAFGLIAIAADGVKEAELVELLILNDDVYNSITGIGDSIRVARIIHNKWLKLKSLASHLLLESYCGSIYFLHSAIHQEVLNRLSPEEKTNLHICAAKYFGNIVPADILLTRLLPQQPMIFNARRDICVWLPTALINHRRCIEAPHHMIEAGMVKEAIIECCSIENIVARIMSCGVIEVINFLADIAHAVDNSPRLHLYLRWVRRYFEFEGIDPYQTLVLCAMDQPTSSIVRMEMVEDMKCKKVTNNFAPTSWIRCKEIGIGRDVDDLIATFSGHEKSVLGVDITLDGRYIASCSEDCTIRIWDAFSAMILHLVVGHKGAVYAVAFSHDGKRIISGSRDKTVCIWCTGTGSLISCMEGHSESVHSVDFNNSGTYAASGSRDRSIIIWDTVSYKIKATLDGHHGVISCVKFGPSDSMLFSASDDETIAMWDVDSRTIVKSYVGHSKAVTALSCCSGGLVLASASRDKTIRVWNVTTGETTAILERHSNRVTSVDINSDGTRVISACDDNHILLWDVKTKSILKSYQHQPVTTVKFFADGHRFASGTFVKKISLWDTTDSPPCNPDTQSEIQFQENIQHNISCSCFTSDGKRIITGNMESTVYIWDVVNGSLLSTLRGHEGPISGVYTKGNVIVTGSLDHMLHVWDLQSTEKKYSVDCKAAVTCFSMNNACSLLFVATEDNKLRLIDIPDHRKMRSMGEGHSDVVLCLQFSRDDSFVVSGGEDNAVMIWDIESLQVRTPLRGHTNRVNCVAVTNNSKHVLSGSADKSIRVWNVENGALVNTLVGHSIAVTAIACSGDDIVVSGSVDKTIRIWNIFAGVSINVLQGHTNRITCIAISEDGHLIASGSSDKTLRIWDASSGERVGL